MLRDGYIFLTIVLIPSILFLFAGIYGNQLWLIPAAIFFLLAVFVAFFFRNPDRVIPSEKDVIVAPADGVVKIVAPVSAANQEEGRLISIFLSVFDVHVNRSPIAGKIISVEYQQGKFLNAMNNRSSTDNEQNVVTVENGSVRVVFKQIAGVIARRIVFWPKAGDSLERGERVGLIRFGSRTDVIVPQNVEVLVRPGDRVKGGETLIGRITRRPSL
jgi:phosphatidylserine decarboxylase